MMLEEMLVQKVERTRLPLPFILANVTQPTVLLLFDLFRLVDV